MKTHTNQKHDRKFTYMFGEVQCCEVGSSGKTRILKQQNYVYLKLLLNRKEFQKNA